jgi:hypothetical protein
MNETNIRRPDWFFYPGWARANIFALTLSWFAYFLVIGVVTRWIGHTIQVNGQSRIVVSVEAQSTARKPIEWMMIHKFYAALMRLYPRQFHMDFGVEMEGVFKQATWESKTQTLKLFLRELRDFPVNLVRQHWTAIRKEELPMTEFQQTKEPQPGTWGEAFLAGLPHLLIALLLGLGRVPIFDSQQMKQTIFALLGISLASIVAATLIFAWRKGWPLWSASWYLYGTWVIYAILEQAIVSLDIDNAWRYADFLFLGWIVFCIIGYFVLLSKSNLHGLLAVAALFPMLSLTMMDFVPDPIEHGFAIFVGLLAALTAAAIVRKGEFRFALGLVLGLNLIVGLASSYISEYKIRTVLPNGIIHTPEFSDFLLGVGFNAFFGIGLLALPFILSGIWNFGKRKFSS